MHVIIEAAHVKILYKYHTGNKLEQTSFESVTSVAIWNKQVLKPVLLLAQSSHANSYSKNRYNF